MQTELDELAIRAANDRYFLDLGLEGAIKSVIEKTRCHWSAVAGSSVDVETVALGRVKSRRSEGVELSW